MPQVIIKKDSDIREFPFADEVHDMADFIVGNPEVFGSDVLIVARELRVGSGGDSGRIDLLVYDTALSQVGIVELKKNSADEKVLLQTLRYANWIRNNPDAVRYQIKKRDLDVDVEDVDTEAIKVFVVAPKVSQSLVELCQYIMGFDFEFIQLRRYKDESDEIYAVANSLAPEATTPPPTGSSEEYDFHWYESQGVRSEQLEQLRIAIQKLEQLCTEQEWDLRPRYVKWAVRFQTSNGRNALSISLRKTQNHVLRLCLGPEFDLSSIKAESEIAKKIKHDSKDSRWWSIRLDEMKMLEELTPFLSTAYENITN